MRVIPLTQGQVALIDDEDYENIINYPHPWRAEKGRHTFYAASWKQGKTKYSTIRMQNLIVTAPKGKLIDHRNRNGLDNRRQNLRIVTQSENLRNHHKRCGYGSSRFNGVSWQKVQKIWTAYTCIGKAQKKYLGCFKDEIAAAIACDKANIQIFKEKAFLNILSNPYDQTGGLVE